MNSKLRLAVFASHGGSNLQSIIDATQLPDYPAIIALVVSNNSRAFALERAKLADLPAIVWKRERFENDQDYIGFMMDKLKEYAIDLICLAGYMKLIPAQIIRSFKIINVHPALLPKFGGQGMFGLHVHEAVIEAGEKITGATIHQVDEVYDHGKILMQAQVPVLPSDTAEILQQRVLEVEHKIYPETIARLARGEISLNG